VAEAAEAPGLRPRSPWKVVLRRPSYSFVLWSTFYFISFAFCADLDRLLQGSDLRARTDESSYALASESWPCRPHRRGGARHRPLQNLKPQAGVLSTRLWLVMGRIAAGVAAGSYVI